MRLKILSLLVLLAACQTPTPVVVVPTLAVLPTETETPIPTDTLTPTETLIPTDTPTPPPTTTFTLSPSSTYTETATHTQTRTFTPSLTITDTITPTFSLTPSDTPDLPLLGDLALLAANVTVLPPEIRYGTGTLTALAQIRALTPANGTSAIGVPPTGVALGTPVLVTLPPPPQTTTCAYPPPGNLNAMFASDPTLQALLGCAAGAPPVPTLLSSAWQPFERGFMIYLAGTPGSIYAITSDGRFRRFDDTFVSGVDPESGGETPPSGLFEPVRGFGKVWRSNVDIRALLGWATQQERGDTASVQLFARGRAIFLPGYGQTYFLFDDATFTGGGTWRMVSGGF
jgi:hypothetical protein